MERVLQASGLKNEQMSCGFGYGNHGTAARPGFRTFVFGLAGADKNKKYPPIGELIAKAQAAKLDGLNLDRASLWIAPSSIRSGRRV
jgi:hypothetical protein